jgi:hypothetical protein
LALGRFRELWSSGKFVAKMRADADGCRQTDALRMYQELSPEFAGGGDSREVLDAIKSRRGEETGRWLREMAPVALIEQKAVGAATTTTSDIFAETLIWIDALFKEFGDLAYEFNKTAIGSELLVSCLAPALGEITTRSESSRVVTKIYQGRLTTLDWTLICRGGDESISVFLLPSPMWLFFTTGQCNAKDYPAFLEMVRVPSTGKWSIGGEIISVSTVNHLAKELMGDLIRVASGVMNESELFSRNADPPTLGQNIAIGYENIVSSPVVVSSLPLDFQNISMPDACDIVDGILDRELKRLYSEAINSTSTSTNANYVRKQISAMEEFRVKMMGAFEEYTRMTVTLSPREVEQASSGPLLLF